MKLFLPENILTILLKQEDTDNDKRITVEDKGPKRIVLESEAGPVVIEGTYFLSNLLQEIILAGEANKTWVESDLVFEKPADRINRMIKHFYWDGLTRSLDEKGLMHLINDSKSKANQAIIYIPYHDQFAFDYFSSLKNKFDIEICVLPEVITPAYVSSINDRGGILALALQKTNDKIQGKPFLVPSSHWAWARCPHWPNTPRKKSRASVRSSSRRPRSLSAKRPPCPRASAWRASASWWSRTATSSANSASSRKT